MILDGNRAARLDKPLPLTLTPKAYAVLNVCDALTLVVNARPVEAVPLVDLDDAPRPGEWACRECGFVWFGTAPDDGLCSACRDAI